MDDEFTARHLEALTLLGGARQEVHSYVIFRLGREDLINAVLDLVDMKMVNRRTQPDYTIPWEDEIFYSLSDMGNKYYGAIFDYADRINPSSKKLGY